MEPINLTSQNDLNPPTQNLNLVQRNLAELLRWFDDNGGGPAINLDRLRLTFAEAVPFSDPFFLPKFNDFGLSAIELNNQKGRIPYPLGSNPPLASDVSSSPAAIFPLGTFDNFVPDNGQRRPP